MTKLRDIDLLSVGVGVVIGMLVLAMGIHIRHHRAIGRGVAPPPSGKPAPVGGVVGVAIMGVGNVPREPESTWAMAPCMGAEKGWK